MDVIDLNERRRAAQEAELPETATCPCGEAWFELRGGPTENGAVCMTPDGSITGYAGYPHCVSCGKPYQRPHGA
jgi:hypothetical protein